MFSCKSPKKNLLVSGLVERAVRQREGVRRNDLERFESEEKSQNARNEQSKQTLASSNFLSSLKESFAFNSASKKQRRFKEAFETQNQKSAYFLQA